MLKGRKLFKTCKQIHILLFKLILILASGRNKLFDVVCYDKRSLSGKKYNIYTCLLKKYKNLFVDGNQYSSFKSWCNFICLWEFASDT